VPFSLHTKGPVQARATHPAQRRFCWRLPPISLREACSTQAAAEWAHGAGDVLQICVCVYTRHALVLLRAFVVGLHYLHTRWLAGCSKVACVYTSNASVLLRAIVVGLYYLHTRWLAGLQIVLLLPLANGIGRKSWQKGFNRSPVYLCAYLHAPIHVHLYVCYI